MSNERMFVITALLLLIAGYLLYSWQTLTGHGTPNPASWAVWAFITVMNFTSYRVVAQDWVKSLLPTTSSLLCVVTFAVVAYQGNLTRLDEFEFATLALGILAGLVWWWKRSAAYAQAIVMIAIAIGFIPTYMHARGEIVLPWVLWSGAFLLQVKVVLMRWKGKKMDLLYPAGSFVLHSAVVPLIFFL